LLPWISSQFVVAAKKSGDLSVCIDPKPLNAALKRERYQIPVIDDVLPDLGDAQVFSKIDLASAFWQLELGDTACFHLSMGDTAGFGYLLAYASQARYYKSI